MLHGVCCLCLGVLPQLAQHGQEVHVPFQATCCLPFWGPSQWLRSAVLPMSRSTAPLPMAKMIENVLRGKAPVWLQGKKMLLAQWSHPLVPWWIAASRYNRIAARIHLVKSWAVVAIVSYSYKIKSVSIWLFWWLLYMCVLSFQVVAFLQYPWLLHHRLLNPEWEAKTNMCSLVEWQVHEFQYPGNRPGNLTVAIDHGPFIDLWHGLQATSIKR